jgi:double-stranded uracil-DNA glycosylase
LGITNLVNRTTAKAAELDASELRRGAATLRRKTARYAPLVVAVLGVGAFRVAFGRPHAGVNLVSSHQIAEISSEETRFTGPQMDALGPSALWILPNPSGLNAHYQLPQLAQMFSLEGEHKSCRAGKVIDRGEPWNHPGNKKGEADRWLRPPRVPSTS